MENLDIPTKMWELGNAITGFAIAQVILTTFAIVKGEIKPLKGPRAHWAAGVLSVFFTVGYIAAIVYCHYKVTGGFTGKTDAQAILRWVLGGQIVAVGFFTAVLLITIGGHWKDEILEAKAKIEADAEAKAKIEAMKTLARNEYTSD